MSTYQLEPIGHIESCFKERFGTPRQPGLAPSSWGRLILRPELNLNDALQGLDGFSHVWVIYIFHRNENKGVNAKVRPPRLNGQTMGLFATRSPHRPNSIGLSVAKIESVGFNEVRLSGLDILDGTPVLDIKPYLPSSDAIAAAKAGWTEGIEPQELEVEVSEQAQTDIAHLIPKEKSKRFNDLVQEMLRLDPRPGFYKGNQDNPDPYTDTYGVRIEDFNVVYKMTGRKANVVAVENWPPSQRRT